MQFQFTISIDKRPYIAANMYYLRRYLGVREIVLFALLFALGLGLFFWTGAIWALVLACLTVVIVAGVVLFYWGTAVQGYKLEFEKRQARVWRIAIDKDTFRVVTVEGEDKEYPEEMALSTLDRVAIKKDRVYLYFSGAMFYYVPYDAAFSAGDFVHFVEWLRDTLPPEKFKMRYKRRNFRQYPYTRA